jgi:hypothetical protein
MGEESLLFLPFNWEVITVDLADENRKTLKNSTPAIKLSLGFLVVLIRQTSSSGHPSEDSILARKV